MFVELMDLIREVRRVAEPPRSSVPTGLTYPELAKHFLKKGERELKDPTRYFEIQFAPVSPSYVSLPQIKGELFVHLKQALSPLDQAYSVGRLSFAIPKESKWGSESFFWGSEPEGYGIGTFGDPSQARIFLTPPGFVEHLSGLLVPMPVEEVGMGLRRDPNPNRLFAKVGGRWETVA